MSTTASTHYDLLCVAPEATASELKVAYRRLMRTYHPDIAGAHGEKMTKLINAAYSELSDEASRRSYDFSIRPQVYEEPAAAQPQPQAQPTARPKSAGPRPAPTQPQAAPTSAPADEEPVFYYKASTHRAWAVATVLLATAVIAALLVMNAEWLNPTTLVSNWRVLAGLFVPISLFVLCSRKTGRLKTGMFLWFCTLLLPLGALNVWPFAGISAELSPIVLICMTAVTPLIYSTRFAFRGLRVNGAARKTLKAAGGL